MKKVTYLLSATICLLMIQGCGEKKVEEKVEVVRPVKTMVVSGTEAMDRTYPGQVQGSEGVNISFRVSGPLIELNAKEGDRVKSGAVLAKIDPRDYNIALSQAKAEFDKADADYQRYKKLYEKDAVALADLDLYRSKRDVGKAKLVDAQSAVKDTILRAPFDGQVGRTFVDNFQEVNAKQDILSIYDAKNIEILIDLPERMVAQYKEGTTAIMNATFEVAPNRKFPLKLKEFSTQADANTQTYRATLIMPAPKGINILPGMTASVEVRLDDSNFREKASITIPANAIFPGDSGESFVWVVDTNNMIVNKRQIKVGSVTGTASIEVFEGLKAGDRIVTAGIKKLREGMKVKLLN